MQLKRGPDHEKGQNQCGECCEESTSRTHRPSREERDAGENREGNPAPEADSHQTQAGRPAPVSPAHPEAGQNDEQDRQDGNGEDKEGKAGGRTISIGRNGDELRLDRHPRIRFESVRRPGPSPLVRIGLSVPTRLLLPGDGLDVSPRRSLFNIRIRTPDAINPGTPQALLRR